MASTPVQRDQFKISSRSITHKPTGATYTPHPGAPHSGTMNLNQLGTLLPNGEDYRPHEVQMMMEQLWVEYVNANPRLFDVHD
jgi:hypothetical protein